MDDPILTTKLNIPGLRPRSVPRPLLVDRLNTGLQRKLTLISAPAGSGKTTLAAEWVHSPGRAAACPQATWLSLDEGDNDPARFLTYLVRALQAVADDVGQTALSLLHPSQGAGRPALESAITLLINDLATLSARTMLILDDYHLIDNVEIHRALAFLLENLPPALHLVTISRQDPMFPLHRLRATGQISELRALDLGLTEDESRQFLNQTMGLDLDPADVSSLNQRTEGWVAGLQMAALSLQNVDNRHQFVTAFAGDDRYIVDYLIAEVLQRLPPDTYSFLLHTSVLDRLAAPLCDAVTGRADSAEILAQLEQANLFLFPLDNKREWYRYHLLFRDLLRYRLRQSVSDDDVAQLYRPASAWCEQAGLLDEAIRYSMAAGDIPRAADLIESVCTELVNQGRLSELGALVDSLPYDLVRSRPWLNAQYVWVLGLTGQTDAIASRLKDMEESLPDLQPEMAREIQGQIAIFRAYEAHNRCDTRQAIDLLHRALQHLPATSVRERSIAQANLGVNYISLGNIDLARKALQVSRTLGEMPSRSWMGSVSASYLAETYTIQGHLTQAEESFREAIALGRTRDGERLFPAAANACAGLGSVLYERGLLDQARQQLELALNLSETAGFWISALRAIRPLAWMMLMEGDTASAQSLMERAFASLRQNQGRWGLGPWQELLAATRAHMALTHQPPQIASAVEWAEGLGYGQTDAVEYKDEYPLAVLARVLLTQGKTDQALELIAGLVEAATARGDSMIKLGILQARAYAVHGQEDSAITTLNRSLDLAAGEGYRRSFTDEGPIVLHLLRRSGHPYAARLLTQAPVDQLAAKAPTPEEPLNEREIEVLRLFAAGLSTTEVAQTLHLSTNTIKWHAKNIHRKLHVGRRTQAIAKARAQGLIP